MENIEFLISQYIDGEIAVDDEKELFALLAQNEIYRKLLQDYIKLAKKTQKYITEELKENSVKKVKVSHFYQAGFYVSTAAAVLVGFLFLLNKPAVPVPAAQETIKQVLEQPMAESIPVTKTVEVKEEKDKEKPKVVYAESSMDSYLKYIKTLKTVELKQINDNSIQM